MTAAKYPALPNSASKADELAYLQTAAANVGPQTYTASLLTPALLKWFEARMREDGVTDVMNYLDHAHRETMNQTALLHEAGAQLEDAKRHAGYAAQKAATAAADLAAQLEKVTAQRNAAETRAAEFAAQLATAETRAADLARMLDETFSAYLDANTAAAK